MFNIVKYNLYRACKSKTIYVLVAVCVLLGGAVTAISQKFDGGVLDFSLVIIAFTVPALIYNDYKDGLARNKIMSGCGRNGVYAANLISSCIIGAGFWLLFQATSIGVMNAISKTPMYTGTHALMYLGIGLLAVVALCSLFTAIAVNMRSHFSLIVCIAIFAALMMFGSSFMNLTAKPSFSPQAREVIGVIYRLIPTGQLVLLENPLIENAWALPLLSAVFIAATSVIGGALFAKKDLK